MMTKELNTIIYIKDSFFVPTAKEFLFSRTEIPFSRTAYTRLRGNKSRSM